MEKIKSRIILSIAIAAFIYLAFIIYVDYEKVVLSFSTFNWIIFPLLLLLSLANYLVRFLKWEYYLGLLKIKTGKIDSLAIFMSGLVMSVTPGKMGELLKSYLLKQVNSTPISKSAPIVLAERATDFLSLTIMALVGAYIFNYGKSVSLIIGVVLVLGIIITTNKKIFNAILIQLSKIKFIGKHTPKIQTAYNSSSKLLSVKPLVLMTLLSAISWGFECVGYFLVVKSFGLNTDMLWAFFSYSFATIIGALSMLPGGLGVTEGSLTLMVIKKGLAENDALASTFIIRVVTLWFAVFVGAISLLFYQKRFAEFQWIQPM